MVFNNLLLLPRRAQWLAQVSVRIGTRFHIRYNERPLHRGFNSGQSRFYSSKKLSRTERRALERKERNRTRREQPRAADKSAAEKGAVIPPFSKFLAHFQRIFHPRLFNNGSYFRWEHLIALGYRVPLAVALGYILTNEDCSPYTVQASLGPSMLPTIKFIGDLWLVETGAWYRLLGWKPAFQKGDVILWKDPETGRVSCKRVVGIEGDRVRRYGEYAALYKDRDDWAIVWPSDAKERNLDSECSWDSGRVKDLRRTFEVPEEHVWLEGDCPPFSLDSRHYGPIPIDWLRGRLILRVWPIQREDEDGELMPSWIRRKRPVPFPSIDQYLGKHFNFYRLQKHELSEDDTQNEVPNYDEH